VQGVNFSVPDFAELLTHIPYRYVFLEKRIAGMKFRNKKEVTVWYTGI
jgi:hypothetical protein